MSNHRSFRDEVDLLLMPVYDRDRPTVPVAAVFGANASGKSNLLDALSWLRTAVLQSYRSWEIDSGIPRDPFRLDRISLAEPSSYVVDVVADGVQYLYGVSLDDEAVREEWLYAYPHAQKRVVFERHGQELVLGSTVADRRGRAEVLSSLMRPNALLLSAAAQAEQSEILPVYRWFRDGLRQTTTNPAEDPRRIVAAVTAALDLFPEFAELVRVADLGISDVVVTGLGHDPGERSDKALLGAVAEKAYFARRRVVFLHGDSRLPLEWDAQSEGTRTWVRMLMSALAALAGGAVLMVDEIDSSLHPRLTARLIELFRSPKTNEHGAQLVFTTHDATLLGTSLGEEILRRDEIWFVEKTAGGSKLYPLSNFHPRKGENRERRYLGGSYGAVPVVFTDTLVDGALAVREDLHGAPA